MMPFPVDAALTYQRSFDDLGTPLVDVTFCIVDLETTGGDRTTDSITEIGAVKVRGGECIGTFQTLVNPGRAIPPQVSVLTGLTDMMVATAPPIEAVLPTFLEFLGSAVIVGHNVGFDLAFLRRACAATGREPLAAPVVDTVGLARRLVRDEVPDCRLGTLASRLRLDHRPAHRALDDAMATTDLLHLLIERAAGHGVTGLDDLLALATMAGHAQAAKLRLTVDLPRTPGVYTFRGHGDEVLYVGKASNIRQRVRSYFGGDDRRKVSALLRETQAIGHVPLPDPLTAEVVEQRMIARLLPRYNRKGTRADRYCYIRLDCSSPWPRLSVVRAPSTPAPTGQVADLHLGPLSSRPLANLVIEALHDALPLRRCTTRLGRTHRPALDATPCRAAQLGVAMCPCSGAADPAAYATAVRAASLAMSGDAHAVAAALHARMAGLAGQQRYEEAAATRDRLAALLGAVRRRQLIDALVSAADAVVSLDGHAWEIHAGRLIAAGRAGSTLQFLPVPPPDAPSPGQPVDRDLVDEVLVLARWCDRHAADLEVRASGPWRFPVSADATVPPLRAAA